jgi:coenzyme F420-dependent glucose-6-phosphate dehydrogenase
VTADLFDGRFFLGLGTGENLNEGVTGARWPAPDERIAMLTEAIEVLRLLWAGGEQTHRGRHYTVDHARIYTLPEEPIPIAVAAAKPKAAELAGRLGDGFVTTDPSEELLGAYRAAGGDGPRYGQVKLCWAESQQEATKLVHELWPTSALAGTQGQELPRPSDFEAAVQNLTEEQTTADTPCGPDPEPVLAAIRKWEEAGFDHIALHQIGPDQEGFLRFWRDELQPRLG